jgi:hypothetical protein
MGVHHSSSLIIGISLQEFFIKVGEKVETFDEFDRKGNNISSSTDKTNNAGFLIGTNGKNNNSKKEVKIVGFSAENN